MRVVLVLIVLFPGSVLEASGDMDFEKIFESELSQRGVEFKKIEPNIYEISTSDGLKNISLQNVEKNYLRDADQQILTRFITTILAPISDLPSWDVMSKGVFLSLEASDYQGLEDVIHKNIGDTVVVILAYYNPDSNQVRWVRTEDLNDRKVEVSEAWKMAESNLEKIMENTNVTFTEIDGEKLAMIEASEPYKASLILTKALKDKVIEELGWPAFAVAPARDFVYLFSQKGTMIDKLGQVVVKEFDTSGYPISTDVWALGDGEAKTIGAYAQR